ncbi:MAG TPA: hypothetical protein DDW51_23695 [Cyanobacteria bacterium UBA11367]|nr:hypothetical protein [Cyanobacteria bacterium UBA11367]
MNHFNASTALSGNQRLELLQEANKLIATATQAAGGPIGLEPVIGIMQFVGVYDTPTPLQSIAVEEILGEVETAGIKLTPGLVVLIKNSPRQNVLDARASYIKAYGKGGGNNPANLFYRILENENLRKSKVEV